MYLNQEYNIEFLEYMLEHADCSVLCQDLYAILTSEEIMMSQCQLIAISGRGVANALDGRECSFPAEMGMGGTPYGYAAGHLSE